jgi:hypothetical protein
MGIPVGSLTRSFRLLHHRKEKSDAESRVAGLKLRVAGWSASFPLFRKQLSNGCFHIAGDGWVDD